MNHDQNDETNFERRQELRHDEEAFRLHQEEKRLRVARQNSTFSWIINSIFWLVGMLELLLLIRFLLRLLDANPKNEFAQLINNLSAPFIAPFSSLFISPTSDGGTNIFDINIVIAIVAYALLSYLVVSLLRLIFYRES
jgi:YggT family protein